MCWLISRMTTMAGAQPGQIQKARLRWGLPVGGSGSGPTSPAFPRTNRKLGGKLSSNCPKKGFSRLCHPVPRLLPFLLNCTPPAIIAPQALSSLPARLLGTPGSLTLPLLSTPDFSVGGPVSQGCFCDLHLSHSPDCIQASPASEASPKVLCRIR